MLLHASLGEAFELDLTNTVELAGIITLSIGHLAEAVMTVGFAGARDVSRAKRVLTFLVAREVGGCDAIEKSAEERFEQG